MKDNLNQRVRDHLATLDAPTWPQPVAKALNAPASSVRNALSSMRKAGLVMYQDGVGYMAGGRKPLSIQEASALGGKARAAKAMPKRPKPIVMVPRKLGVTEAPAVKETFPDTDSWIAANPEKVIRLPAGVWANPVLRFEY